MSDFSIQWADWQRDYDGLTSVRKRVFVDEQQVPIAEEMDDMDDQSLHVKAITADARIIGTSRLLPAHYIGRMCVLSEWRKRGVASAMMKFLIAHARAEGISALYLNAQITALTFYQQFGFVADSEIFIEAGIDHRHMSLQLSQ